MVPLYNNLGKPRMPCDAEDGDHEACAEVPDLSAFGVPRSLSALLEGCKTKIGRGLGF